MESNDEHELTRRTRLICMYLDNLHMFHEMFDKS